MPTPSRPRFGLLLFLAAWAAGCGGTNALPNPTDPEAARGLLTRTLDAWKAGEPAAKPDRDVHVADEDWLAGWKLADYQLGGDARALGTNVRQPVALSLVDPRGKAVKKRVVYQVGTDPRPSVVRQDGS